MAEPIPDSFSRCSRFSLAVEKFLFPIAWATLPGIQHCEAISEWAARNFWPELSTDDGVHAFHDWLGDRFPLGIGDWLQEYILRDPKTLGATMNGKEFVFYNKNSIYFVTDNYTGAQHLMSQAQYDADPTGYARRYNIGGLAPAESNLPWVPGPPAPVLPINEYGGVGGEGGYGPDLPPDYYPGGDEEAEYWQRYDGPTESIPDEQEGGQDMYSYEDPTGDSGVIKSIGTDALERLRYMGFAVAKSWKTGTTTMAIDVEHKKMAAMRKDGTWKVWTIKKPMVIVGRPSKSQIRRLMRYMASENKTMEKILESQGFVVHKPGYRHPTSRKK